MPGRYAAAALAALVLLLAAPVALAVLATVDGAAPVIPQTSIRGIQLGMDPERVHELLDDKPDTTSTQAHPIVERTTTMTWGGLRVVYDGVKAGARVISVSTTSRLDRTIRGVGVGSSEATVRKRVPGVACRTAYGYRRCSIGKAIAGEAVTDFSISRKGRVSRISLSRVLD